MEQAQHGGEDFVLRRLLTGSILVATHHAVIGPVFLQGVESSEMGVPDSYGLTTDIVQAKRYKPGAAPHGIFEDRVRGDWIKLVGMAEVSPSAIAFWTRPEEITREIDTTVWLEIPAPPMLYFLSQVNGFIGYRAKWTSDLSSANRFSSSSVLVDADIDFRLDGEIARRLGRFVPLATASAVPADAWGDRIASSVNHALEADVSWTLHRSAKRYGLPLENHQRDAFQHAGNAGWERSANGYSGPVSGHIDAFAELAKAFNIGYVLQQCVCRRADLRNEE